MRHKISVIADSLAMPRVEGDDIVLIENTWPYILNELIDVKKHAVFSFGKRARNSNSLNLDFYENVTVIQPECIIIQVGIVDASPRIFSRREKMFLGRLPNSLREKLIEFRSRQRSSITRKNPMAKVEVTLDKFKSNFYSFISSAPPSAQRIIMIPIIANMSYMEKKSPGFLNNTEQYNEALKSFSSKDKIIYHDIGNEFDNDSFCSDGYHLSTKGNHALARSLKNYFIS